jgi:hypothetical protein
MTKIEMQPIESIETRHFLAPSRAMRMREGSRARSLRTLSSRGASFGPTEQRAENLAAASKEVRRFQMNERSRRVSAGRE